MNKITPLIQNENMKIYRRLRTWIMIGLIVFTNLAMAIVMRTSDFSSTNHVLEFVLTSVNLNFLAVMFTIVVAGDIIASEFTWGTIKLLLIRPVSRTKILWSKYIATLLFAFVLLVIIFLSSFIFGFLFFGSGGSSKETLGGVFNQYGLGLIDMIMTATFAFMISTVFRSSALAIALSFILWFMAGNVVGILSGLGYAWGKYILFANTNLRQYAEGNIPMFEGMTLGFSITMIIVYFALFHLISWYVFKKRDVAV